MRQSSVNSRESSVMKIIFIIFFLLVTGHWSLVTDVHADELTAKAAIAIDADTGTVLYAKNPHLKRPPASTVKVMTALLTLEMSNLERLVVVSANASAASGSRLKLNGGDKVKTEELLYALLLKSANDAAIALAESVSGSEVSFVNLMNKKAKEIGAKDTHFINASGLPGKGQYTTASDLSIIMREALKEEFLADVLKTRVAVIDMENGARKVALRNHNKLLWMYEGAEGGKTGYTVSARHCFVGEASRDVKRVIIAVLGSRRLWDDAIFLFDKGFRILSKEENPRIYVTREMKNNEKPRVKGKKAKVRT